ncbi:MAG: VWA domain-containing protein [Pseudomonadota bacterium]
MRRNLYAILVATFFLSAALSSNVIGQDTSEPELSGAADVRIIVDISGSMKDNDPDNLRQPAVRLLARMLPEDAGAGVWTFGQYVNMLVPYASVGDDWRNRAITRSADINSVALRTNLGEAIEVASDDFFTDGNLDSTDFILLTDGKVDISDDEELNREERERILGPVLDRLISKGATIHTVALSDEADSRLLQTLAARTGGSYNVAPSAEALNLAFLDALNAAVPQQQVPIEGDGFSVDSGVEEFTALIFWGEDETSDTRKLELTDPDGNTAVVGNTGEGMRWAREAGYDLITVSEPVAGQWRIHGELGEGSRVTVVSDLRMVVTPLPSSFSAEQPLELQIAFFEGDEKLTDPEFLSVLDVGVSLTSEDNRSGNKVLSSDGPPDDGIYRDTIGGLPAAGKYAIEVVADGQTFTRKFSGFSRFEVPQDAAGTVPEVAPTVAESEVVSPESEPAPESEAAAEPEPAEGVTEENSASGPIDVSELEEPAEVETSPSPPEPADSDSSGLPLWAFWAAGVAVVGLVGAGLFVAFKRKKAASEPVEPDHQPATETESETDEVPVVEPEPEAEPEPAAEPDEVDASTVAMESADPAMDEDSKADDHKDAPTPVPEPLSEAGDEEIPVADAEVDEGLEDFGLEDFDLSEFDDLPDAGEKEKGRLDDEADNKPKPKE